MRLLFFSNRAQQLGEAKLPLLALLVLMLVSLVALLLLPPIPQDQAYHQFADKRTLLGIPNFWNVVSNFPFVIVGAAGLWQLHRDSAVTVLFVGVLMTGFGSAYYHWSPSDRTLFWDRLPMALTFMAILAVAIEDRVSARAGAILLWPLLATGVLSLLLWRWTGDLRLYGWVQFFPAVALTALLLFPPKQAGTSYWILAGAFYGLAKLLEHYDGAIFSVISVLSGHTLKHLAAAAACFVVLRYFKTRPPCHGPLQKPCAVWHTPND